MGMKTCSGYIDFNYWVLEKLQKRIYRTQSTYVILKYCILPRSTVNHIPHLLPLLQFFCFLMQDESVASSLEQCNDQCKQPSDCIYPHISIYPYVWYFSGKCRECRGQVGGLFKGRAKWVVAIVVENGIIGHINPFIFIAFTRESAWRLPFLKITNKTWIKSLLLLAVIVFRKWKVDVAESKKHHTFFFCLYEWLPTPCNKILESVRDSRIDVLLPPIWEVQHRSAMPLRMPTHHVYLNQIICKWYQAVPG